ncbi:hypothetical protein TSUD_32260 [Trifolium subterraneum]|uniref:Uncharacterized protein n=1 Tax=Trifolium subterraneum TaxID=3900 RepID=A0A2Z6MX52_TRISU|nr:hypothetical protein TSUD_32260 [Trifolium subterraneum]
MTMEKFKHRTMEKMQKQKKSAIDVDRSVSVEIGVCGLISATMMMEGPKCDRRLRLKEVRRR